MSIPTPHIGAKKGDFAKTVLMPGDPLRAKYIAEENISEFDAIFATMNAELKAVKEGGNDDV